MQDVVLSIPIGREGVGHENFGIWRIAVIHCRRRYKFYIPTIFSVTDVKCSVLECATIT